MHSAYNSHLRRIYDSEAYYGGQKPAPIPFTTDRDILDSNHKFLRDPNDNSDPLIQQYYESLIKDCVLIDLSRYKVKQVAMRWRTIDEVKVGKGDKICANIACGRSEGLEGMEVLFGYVEDGAKKDVLVKCVVCEKCGRKLRKARGTVRSEKERDRSRKRKESRELEKSVDHRFEWAKSKSPGSGKGGKTMDEGLKSSQKDREAPRKDEDKDKHSRRDVLELKRRKTSVERPSLEQKPISQRRAKQDDWTQDENRKLKNPIGAEDRLAGDRVRKLSKDDVDNHRERRMDEFDGGLRNRDIKPIGKRAIRALDYF